jgi:hypothetical protein
MTKQYGVADHEVARYTCKRTAEPLVIDGKLDEGAWQRVEKSSRFVDLVSGEPGYYDTHAAALWDDDYLYIGFWVEEPFVQAKLTERDSLIYMENDVEVFIDGGDCYYEFEINALGTLYEVFFIWQDAFKHGSKFDIPEFDLLTNDVDLLGGFQDISRHEKHARGKRWAYRNWDFPGIKTAVHVDGTINDNSDIDKGWTVELAFSWSGMTHLANGRSLPPKEGDVWRVEFSRFQRMHNCGGHIDPHPGWAWNRNGVYDSHIPECFPYLTFSDEVV